MQLRPQDVLVLLKLVASDKLEWSYTALARELSMSASEVHSALQRALAAGLAYPDPNAEPKTRGIAAIRPHRAALLELLTHGLRYVFVPDKGGETRGMPTAHAAPPLNDKIVDSSPLPPVWPTPDGTTRGWATSPLYKSAPAAAARDPALYELLALTDAMRSGRARERTLAQAELERRLVGPAP